MSQSHYQEDKSKVIEWYNNGEYTVALDLANKLIRRKPDYELLVTKSYIEEQLGYEKEAIRSLTDALKINSEETTLFFRRGVLAYRQGWYPQAIEDLSMYINSPPKTTTGIIYQMDESGGEQLKIRSSNSLMGEAYSHRGMSYNATNEREKAQADLLMAIELNPEASYYVNLALIHIERRDTFQAIAQLNTALELSPANSAAWYNLMLINPNIEVPDSIFKDPVFYPMVTYRMIDAIQEEDYLLASRLVKGLLKSEYNPPETYVYAGRISYGLKDFKEAIDFFNQAKGEKADSEEIDALLGNCYFQLREFEAAVSHYEIHLVNNHDDRDTWFNAAVAYHRVGDLDNMCRCLDRSIALGITNSQSERMLRLCQ
jgi:tetratricopeptide (TPR) repeat protein